VGLQDAGSLRVIHVEYVIIGVLKRVVYMVA
jgi:hypothetical protein